MATDIEKHLVAVEERARQAESDWDQLIASQADVPTLLAMVRALKRLRICDKTSVMWARSCAEVDRLAREAMEAKHE